MSESVHEFIYEKEYVYRVFKNKEFFDQNYKRIWAQTNEKSELFAKIDFNIFHNEAKEKFLLLLNKHRSFFPGDFIIFDPLSVKQHMGEFQLHYDLTLGSDGLKNLFSNSAHVCRDYAKNMGISKPDSWCRKKQSHRVRYSRLRRFLKRFARARELYLAYEKMSPWIRRTNPKLVHCYLHW